MSEVANSNGSSGTSTGSGTSNDSAFDRAFAFTVGVEGGYTADPQDPGNWTGGEAGVGTLKGTKYGISAASYPGMNIEALTLATAKTIYRRDYWNKMAGDSLPPELACVTFDAAVNSGVREAGEWLQMALEVSVDGLIGPETVAAAKAANQRQAAVYAIANRLAYDWKLATADDFGLGWTRRCVLLAMEVANVR